MLQTALQFEGLILSLLGTVFLALFAVIAYATNKYFVTQTDYAADREQSAAVIQKLADTIDNLADRLMLLEKQVSGLPTESMLHQLNVSIAGMAGVQQTQQVQLDNINKMLVLIQTHLLKAR